MELNNYGYTNPKDTLRSLKIYKSVIKKQMSYFPLSMDLLRLNSRKLIAVLDIYINDYEQYFKNRNLATNLNSHQLSFEDNALD